MDTNDGAPLSRGDRKRRYKEMQAQQQQQQQGERAQDEGTGEALVKRLKNSSLLPLAADQKRYRRCIIEYDGTNFQGFQAQEQRGKMRTVQETIENAITRTTGETVRARGCSRTDKGVHARGQVVVFASCCTTEDRVFRDAINTRLPDDVVCRSLRTLAAVSAEGADEAFDPRTNAIGKIYEYVIVTGSIRPVLDRHHVWAMTKRPDTQLMRAAAAHLTASPAAKDYSAFTPSKSNKLNQESGNSTICTIFSIDITEETITQAKEEGDDDSVKITIRFHGDRFLYKMVRNLVGTLVDVGLGRIQPATIPVIIDTKDRSKAGQGAPPHGLTLVRVLYREDQ